MRLSKFHGCQKFNSGSYYDSILPMNAYGQQADCDSLSVKNRGLGNYEFKWRQTILPASLIGAGAVALAPGFIRNGSRDITNNVIDIRGSNKRIEFDDYV